MARYTDCADGEDRIPPSLFNVYLRYKQDTRAIVSWLTRHGGAEYNGSTKFAIYDLFAMATVVKSTGVAMPDTMGFHFREAIAGRTHLSRYFRKQGNVQEATPETCDHEYFTASLSRLYRMLSGTGLIRRDSGVHGLLARPPADDSGPPSNRFDLIAPAGSEPLPTSPSNVADWCCDDHTTAPERSHNPAHAKNPSLVDDTLGDAIEIRKLLQDMEDLLLPTTKSWEQAGRHRTPLVVAVLLSSTAFEDLSTIVQRLEMLSDPDDPSAFRMSMEEAYSCLSGPVLAPKESTESLPGWLQSLLQAWQTMHDLKLRGPAGESCNVPSEPGEHTYILVRKGPDSASMDNNCLGVLLHNIVQHLKAKTFAASSFYSTCQAATTVHSYLVGGAASGLHASLALCLLLNSCKSYFFASEPKLAPSSCRLQVLQFAQRATPHIAAVLDDASMPCKCPDTLAYRLDNLQTDLEAFVRTKCFDLYFQSPWASGSHLLGMLEALFYYGLRLVTYRNYVGSVVHIYNVLRQLTDFAPIPVLDGLSKTFEHIIFPGGRPTRHFKACYTRHRGGRLRFSSGSSVHKNGCHSVQVPAHTAKATAGFGRRAETKDPRLDYRKVSLLFEVREKEFRLDRGTWDRVLHRGAEQHVVEQEQGRAVAHCDHHHCASPAADRYDDGHRLQSLEHAVMQDFSGTTPVAKVNLFKVFLACARITEIITSKTHTEPPERPGLYCLCYADALLLAADRYKDCEHKMQPLGHRDLVKACQAAILEVLGEARVEEYLWEGI